MVMQRKCFSTGRHHPKRLGWLPTLLALGTAMFAGVAASAPLPPHTKIRLSVVQWMPTKGVYEQWGSIGGDFTISDAGTVSVPVLGSIAVGNLDDDGLAAEIANRLKEKIGLVDAPATTVQILEYSPVYVVGDVSKPGEYKFSSGLTVLQALALGGGEYRAPLALEGAGEVTRLAGSLKELDDAITRSNAKIVRLEAEMAGATSVNFSQQPDKADPFAAAVYNQEKVIFEARANAVDRKAKSFAELRDLLNEEIGVLEQKTKSTDENIKSIQQQVDSTAMLVAKGAVVATRQGEVERALRSYQDTRLDISTAIMRARQSISQTTRDLQALYDERKTEVASDLQSERAALVQLKLKRETSQKLVLDSLSSLGGAVKQDEKPVLGFVIVRRENGTINEISASETSALMPGDVVKVTRPSLQAVKPVEQVSAIPGADQASR
ncbi:polysaccharide biosynthesis/export family protein [Rhizobium sp. S163]|uniref:polysaccharide biosynthesis/export family protein n=1 Tax=Rhizobium sp. S163 TaxID=3055039 RepID=UPI0025A9E5D6|nr:polysaccharide biosynthesis/export family protein [Rhizobium sp. S163]MDM9646282.1 exopolysaccharide biosynthesis protein [Rhizobium sp. S163]